MAKNIYEYFREKSKQSLHNREPDAHVSAVRRAKHSLLLNIAKVVHERNRFPSSKDLNAVKGKFRLEYRKVLLESSLTPTVRARFLKDFSNALKHIRADSLSEFRTLIANTEHASPSAKALIEEKYLPSLRLGVVKQKQRESRKAA